MDRVGLVTPSHTMTDCQKMLWAAAIGANDPDALTYLLAAHSHRGQPPTELFADLWHCTKNVLRTDDTKAAAAAWVCANVD
jgi:hypothetical protein